MPYAILAAVLVALDQLVKYLVLQNIELGAHVPFIPHLLELTYVKNTGAAFSIFSEHTWLLALAIWKNFFHHPLGKVILTLLLAGAVGNLIDRVFRGFVVDMFNVLFMNFAVFNVADICVVVGGISAGLYYLFLADKLEPGRKGSGEHDDAEAAG